MFLIVHIVNLSERLVVLTGLTGLAGLAGLTRLAGLTGNENRLSIFKLGFLFEFALLLGFGALGRDNGL